MVAGEISIPAASMVKMALKSSRLESFFIAAMCLRTNARMWLGRTYALPVESGMRSTLEVYAPPDGSARAWGALGKRLTTLVQQHGVCAYAIGMAVLFVAVVPLSFVGPKVGDLNRWHVALNTLFFGALLFLAANGSWLPEARVPRGALIGLGLASLGALMTYQLFHFYSFNASGTDFTQCDRMLFNTNHGRFMYSPIYEVNYFGIHPSYIVLPLVPLHRLFESPVFLVVVTGLVLWAPIIPLWFLAKKSWNEWGALLALIAYLTNRWVLVVIDGGFRPEVFYPLLGFSFLSGWISKNWRIWLPSLVGFLSVKEDAALMCLAFTVGVFLFERTQWRAATVVGVISILVLALDVDIVQPIILRNYPKANAPYGSYWGYYGNSFGGVVAGMLRHPGRVIADVVTSNWYRMFGPALFLPLLSRRALSSMLPMLVILGSSAQQMMRNYVWYYPLPLVAFLFWGILDARRELSLFCSRPVVRDGLFAFALLLFPLIGGRLRFAVPDWSKQRAIRLAMESLAQSKPVLCVQEALAPQVPYRFELSLLSPKCASQPKAIAFINTELDPFPFNLKDLRAMVDRARVLGQAQSFGAGFYLLRGQVFGP